MAKRRVPPPEDPDDTNPTTETTTEGTGLDPTTLKCDGNHGGAACADPECWQRDDPEPSDELKAAIEDANVDLAPQDQVPAVGGVVASAPVSKAPLFDEATFDPERACHEIFRKTETVRSARSAYELAKEEASDKKKVLDARSKELEDLIKELQWKEQRALQAKREPKLVEASDGVEGVGELSTDPLEQSGDIDSPVDEGSEGEGSEDGVGPSTDADGHDEAAAG